MAAHVCLKNEFTEDEKHHNLMSWLILFLFFFFFFFKIGSFVVIEEAIESMPFTPYTLLVLHDEHLRKIPVVKHSLKQRKVRYTLVNAPEPKLASIKFY